MQPDPFDILGVPSHFRLSRIEIEQAYLKLASSIHPDLAAGDDDAARKMAEINRARQILEDPELRADALLRHLGGPAADQERSLPDRFLMDIMEVREQMEAALDEPDPARRLKAVQHWIRWSQEERARTIEEVGIMFAGLSDGPKREEQLRAIRVRLNAWRYVERLIEQINS